MKDIRNLDGCDTPAGRILAKPHALSYYDDMKESFERRNDKTVFLHLNTPLIFVAHVSDRFWDAEHESTSFICCK